MVRETGLGKNSCLNFPTSERILRRGKYKLNTVERLWKILFIKPKQVTSGVLQDESFPIGNPQALMLEMKY